MSNKELAAARGIKKADMVLKNAGIINVFTEAIDYADIAICNGKIVGIGTYEGDEELDCTGKYAAPGFIDGHIHLESSMLKPLEFAKAVLPHGTTAVIADPHEIANVCGLDGIRFMREAAEGLPLDIYFMVPSCVPSTVLDENGAVLKAENIKFLYEDDRILGLAEVMDYYGTIQGDEEIQRKLTDVKAFHKLADGHAPGLSGKDLCAYITVGIGSDHECVDLAEAKEKLKLGQWIMVREGTAAKNLNALMGLFEPPYHQRTLLVTDDKHPSELLQDGHMDDILRKAVRLGADPCIAIKMATLNTAVYFGLREVGAIAPGYRADIVLLKDLKDMLVEKVIKNGKLIVNGEAGLELTEPEVEKELLNRIRRSVNCRPLEAEDFRISKKEEEKKASGFRVIRFLPGEITTEELIAPLTGRSPEVSLKDDILKLAVVERHHDTGHIGLGFVKGYGLTGGAIASSIAHDSHNIVVIGTKDSDMAAAVNCVRQMQGGWAITREGVILGKLPLPIAGLMSDMTAEELAERMKRMKDIAAELGVAAGIDPFMTPAFVCLPVIPRLRLITTGLYDVVLQKQVPLIID